MTKRLAAANPTLANSVATATQAGLEKGLFDQLAKGHRCAARALLTMDDQQHLTFLIEAEIAYQNALCLVTQAGTDQDTSHKASNNSEPSSKYKTHSNKETK